MKCRTAKTFFGQCIQFALLNVAYKVLKKLNNVGNV